MITTLSLLESELYVPILILYKTFQGFPQQVNIISHQGQFLQSATRDLYMHSFFPHSTYPLSQYLTARSIDP